MRGMGRREGCPHWVRFAPPQMNELGRREVIPLIKRINSAPFAQPLSSANFPKSSRALAKTPPTLGPGPISRSQKHPQLWGLAPSLVCCFPSDPPQESYSPQTRHTPLSPEASTSLARDNTAPRPRQRRPSPEATPRLARDKHTPRPRQRRPSPEASTTVSRRLPTRYLSSLGTRGTLGPGPEESSVLTVFSLVSPVFVTRRTLRRDSRAAIRASSIQSPRPRGSADN